VILFVSTILEPFLSVYELEGNDYNHRAGQYSIDLLCCLVVSDGPVSVSMVQVTTLTVETFHKNV
jgi:predicted transcriptional regulator